jgi:hypothetical protein
MSATDNLPVVGGFYDDDDRDGGRLIIGTKLKCTDGQWSAADGSELRPETRYIVRGTVTAAQLWQDNIPVETIIKEPGKPFPDIDELNGRIPVTSWATGIDGKPRPPWVITRVVYLIRLPDAKQFTFLNSTFGAKLAVGGLRDQVNVMRELRGTDVVPLVALRSAPFKTKVGQKLRPDFEVVEFREVAGARPAPLLEAKAVAPTAPATTKPVKAVEAPTAPVATEKIKAVEIGKPVAPVTTRELLDDEVPF